MFGYVVPLSGELKVWELDAYQVAYCGLCHTSVSYTHLDVYKRQRCG